VQFNEYLKVCRDNNKLTQEELVSNLYSYDIDSFGGLDTSTLSKWERSATKPKASKQVSIMKYFQELTGYPLPCMHENSEEEAQELICKAGVRNLLGKNKQLIFNFPSEFMSVDDMNISPLRSFERMDALIESNMHIQQGFNHPYAHISQEQVKEWALHPSSLFLGCEHKGCFLGLFFTVKVKPEVFAKIVNFEMKKGELTTEDFATSEEQGSMLMLSFFAMNEKAAMMLIIRYFAHLIANQDHILEMGGVTTNDEAKKITGRMNLQSHKHMITEDKTEVLSLKQTLPNVLASEYVLTMILSKQECPEE